MAISHAATLPNLLAEHLAAAPACDLPRGLAPTLAYGRHQGPPRADARRTAVLFLLYPNHDQWHLPLTRRQPHLVHHGGQVSLPGGALEPGESPREAAVRETVEELGVAATDLHLLGTLAPLYVFNSNFLVEPWVAFSELPLEFEPNEEEVAEIIELPLSALLANPGGPSVTIQRGGLQFSAPCFHWQDAQIWGATRILLGAFATQLHALQALDPPGGQGSRYDARIGNKTGPHNLRK